MCGLLGWGENFLTKSQKGTSLADFTCFECAYLFTGFCFWRVHEKGTLQKVTERLYFTYSRGIPTQPNVAKIGVRVEVTDVSNHTKFGNDRSREYKVTEGQILACLACRL